ncbi:TetR/AcrR family transcriptional regulator [Streptococcus iniae]|uniref:TetR family transcriptional regulator n=1 Tax=Streptococcus iniae TaxID=1346 RepID=A0A3L8G9Z0_STRIN|nr:TetR-like C-terminal domain-containing protein [Streptococcus iniae]AGM99920.1 transcriptional regulator TetR family [Streptococcus iniae SF1]AHY16762.1 TetR family transcriptional regulator [Streptococcus iniae]AHY18627.1 TetR family transcriptional regulator [Streptococcus iniae]AJG26889.1 TetR family transcriptional regulator [Streptococcus iniae]APD32787.1 TetR family transcriptional regulator [Streptococcus iniae]
MLNTSRKELTKKALLDALVDLLKTNSFDDITTKQLAITAGISRSSFYTHYKDKYEMIDSYQQILFHKLEYVFDKEHENWEHTFEEIFSFLQNEQLLSALLSVNGTKEIQNFIIHKVRKIIVRETLTKAPEIKLSQKEREYHSIFLSHAFFGTCQEWIAKGKKESPKEMTAFILKMLSR